MIIAPAIMRAAEIRRISVSKPTLFIVWMAKVFNHVISRAIVLVNMLFPIPVTESNCSCLVVDQPIVRVLADAATFKNMVFEPRRGVETFVLKIEDTVLVPIFKSLSHYRTVSDKRKSIG